ncbi:Type 1 glutamine amidotransferase-like domain-containing protein [Bacillus sp. Marseille-Q1617]|uniref:Type 1 glutamine amidotransferase-like domain-containing protein n=1 Tax=Bacillus sp. Marseille-Q1617 TaxID=2736887 RepID=UPI00158AFA1A|nr:Type 1 glutamine amidotransferase-like domain-containing protein [Bacillus sp. Marseille-Q1617]
MGTIVISGGGNEQQTEDIDRHFVSLLNRARPLLYIPVAMEPSSVSYEACCEWIKGVFSPLGIKRIVMWTDLEDKSLVELMDFFAVYIGGGNTFRLLKILKDTHFSKLIREYLKTGGTVYGGSAGGIVLGSHIMTCALNDENKEHLENNEGLGLLDRYAILCHYEKGQQTFIRSFINNFQLPVIALSEETGLCIKGCEIQVIGNKNAVVFDDDGNREVEIGALLK